MRTEDSQSVFDALVRIISLTRFREIQVGAAAKSLAVSPGELTRLVQSGGRNKASHQVVITQTAGRAVQDWVLALHPFASESTARDIVFVPDPLGPRPCRFAAHFAALVAPGYVTCHGASESAVRRAVTRANKAAGSRRYSATKNGGVIRLWLNPPTQGT